MQDQKQGWGKFFNKWRFRGLLLLRNLIEPKNVAGLDEKIGLGSKNPIVLQAIFKTTIA
jgi:hypothetical protein